MNSDKKYLIIVFTVTGKQEDNIYSYASQEEMVELGLDPSKSLDIKLNFKENIHVVSLDLISKEAEKHKEYRRDFNLRKILGEI